MQFWPHLTKLKYELQKDQTINNLVKFYNKAEGIYL